MYEGELTVKRYILASLLTPSHARVMQAMQSHAQIRIQDENMPESRYFYQHPDEAFISLTSLESKDVITKSASSVPQVVPWVIESTLSSTNYSTAGDVGGTDGVTPQQLRVYLSALSLEALVETIEMDHVANIIKHLAIHQLSVD